MLNIYTVKVSRITTLFTVAILIVTICVIGYYYIFRYTHETAIPMYTEYTKITKETAIDIATQAEGGFLGTWVNATLEKDGWHVSASSKSAKPPVLYIIDSQSGDVIYVNKNTDQVSTPTTTSTTVKDKNKQIR
jgi:hypothetical protein